MRNLEMKILKKEELVRARVLHSTFTISGPRPAPPDPNPPTFTPRFSCQALARGGPEHLHTKIFSLSLGQWRPRAQKEMTFTINFAIQQPTSQKILAQASPNPQVQDMLSQKRLRFSPKGSPQRLPVWVEVGLKYSK